MSRRRNKGLKATAVIVAFAIAQVYVQISFAELPSTATVPSPQNIIIGRLTTRNSQPITVNGNSAASGASIQTGATIQTPADVSATINLGPLGSVDLAPNTTIRLDFDEQGNIKVTLISGCVIIRAKRNTEGQIDTEQGNAAKTDKKKGGILDVCFPPGASSPIVGQGAAAAAGAGVLLGGSAGAVAAGGGIGAVTIGAIVAGGTIAAVAIPIALRGGGGSQSTVSGSTP
ncbi:MAG TPA: hypothetical protein VJ124_05390 [Pyrinomonadaceae bacterium]|nr:hypothetical protein [Pyrinomonadaceae bacterium]